MSDDRKTGLFRAEDWGALARLILEESGAEPMLRSVFSEDFYNRIPMSAAVSRMVPELRKHAGLPNPGLSFVFANRTRRCVASIPFAIFHQIPVVHVPYLDHAVFDFLYSLDPSMMADNRLHDETIRRAFPEFSAIPYEDKGAKAVTRPADRVYYRSARGEFFDYLRRVPAAARGSVRFYRLFARIGTDLVTGRNGAPWYVRPALQAIEMERLRLGC